MRLYSDMRTIWHVILRLTKCKYEIWSWVLFVFSRGLSDIIQHLGRGDHLQSSDILDIIGRQRKGSSAEKEILLRSVEYLVTLGSHWSRGPRTGLWLVLTAGWTYWQWQLILIQKTVSGVPITCLLLMRTIGGIITELLTTHWTLHTPVKLGLMLSIRYSFRWQSPPPCPPWEPLLDPSTLEFVWRLFFTMFQMSNFWN